MTRNLIVSHELFSDGLALRNLLVSPWLNTWVGNLMISQGTSQSPIGHLRCQDHQCREPHHLSIITISRTRNCDVFLYHLWWTHDARETHGLPTYPRKHDSNLALDIVHLLTHITFQHAVHMRWTKIYLNQNLPWMKPFTFDLNAMRYLSRFLSFIGWWHLPLFYSLMLDAITGLPPALVLLIIHQSNQTIININALIEKI